MKREILISQMKLGKSKNDIYLDFVEQGNSREVVAKKLTNMPSYSLYKKYNLLNITLGLFLIFIAIGSLLFAVQIPTAIIYGILAYVVLSYKLKYYPWIFVFSGLAIISLGYLTIFELEKARDLLRILSAWLLMLGSLATFIFLYTKMFKKPLEERMVYQNEYGQNRSYIEYSFSE